MSGDDRVSGNMVIATVPVNNNDKGPQLRIPDDLHTAASIQPYTGDGYVGAQLSFTNLSFDQFSELTNSISQGRQNYSLVFHTTGNLVTFSGSVDLTEVPADRADIELKIDFPGEIISTTGSLNGQTVIWKPKPGDVSQLTATADVSGSSTPSWARWAVLLGVVLVVVVLLIAGLAIAAHRRSLRIYRR